MSKKKHKLQPESKPLFAYWQALYLSFYSSRLYVDVVKRWRGWGILYLLLLIAVVSIPFSVRIVLDFEQYFNEQMLYPLKSIPKFYVQNGEVLFDKPMPYYIKNRKNQIVTIIDTTGKINKITNDYPNLTTLVTQKEIYFRPPNFEHFFEDMAPSMGDKIYVQPLNEESNEVFDGEEWASSSGVLRLKYLTQALVYPMIVCYLFSLYFVFLLVFVFIGQLFTTSIFKVKLNFKTACRLLMVAASPQIYLFSLLFTADIRLPAQGLLYTALVAVYFCYGIISIQRERKKLVFA